jgi:hypothetical protein
VYRAPARNPGRIADRPLAKRRWIAPLVVLAALAGILALRSCARSRVSLRIDSYETPIEHPEGSVTIPPLVVGGETHGAPIPLMLTAPASIAVGHYALRRGIGPFADKTEGELSAWYEAAAVSGARVELVSPRPVAHTAKTPVAFAIDLASTWSGPVAPGSVELGYEPGEPRDDAAESIAAWMNGPRTTPLELTWTTPSGAIAWLVVIGICGLACAFLGRMRTVVWIDGPMLSVESRVFRTRTLHVPRGEIRTVAIDTRPLGPFLFARPAIVTNDGRRISVGAQVLRDVEAAELARRIRAFLA